MVQLDTRLPLMVQQPDIVNALDTGTRAAANQASVMRQAEGQNIFRQYGPGAMQGDPMALAQVAGYDPGLAQGLDFNRQENARADARLGMDRERLTMLRNEVARGLAAEKNQAQAMKEAQMMDRLVQGAVRAHAAGDMTSFARLTEEAFGTALPPTPEGLAALAAANEGAKAYLSNLPKQDGFRNATPEEAAQYGAAGGQFGPDGRFYPINPPSGMELIQNADGTTTFRQGAGVGSAATRGDANIGDVYNPAEVTSTLGLISEIYNDANLARITGPIQGGGGNDVDQLNMVQRLVAGEEGLGTIEKIAQVQSRGWLAARQMLKGGGPITDYESRKAEGAVARMSRAKGEAEFKSALKEFHDAIREGMIKLQGAGELPAGVQIPPRLGVNAVEPTQSRRDANPANRAPGAPPSYQNMTMDQLLENVPTTEEEAAEWNRRFDALEAGQ